MFKLLELSKPAMLARILAMVGAGLVIVGLVLPWYSVDFTPAAAEEYTALSKEFDLKDTAFAVFGGELIAFLVLCGLIIGFTVIAQTTITRRYLHGAWVCAGVLIGLSVWRMISPPKDYDIAAIASVSPSVGPFVSLLAAAFVIAMALWALRAPPAVPAQTCPRCAADVPAVAHVCMYCNEPLVPAGA